MTSSPPTPERPRAGRRRQWRPHTWTHSQGPERTAWPAEAPAAVAALRRETICRGGARRPWGAPSEWRVWRRCAAHLSGWRLPPPRRCPPLTVYVSPNDSSRKRFSCSLLVYHPIISSVLCFNQDRMVSKGLYFQLNYRIMKKKLLLKFKMERLQIKISTLTFFFFEIWFSICAKFFFLLFFGKEDLLKTLHKFQLFPFSG